ncbi:putative PIG3 family NAD(P)H quinone oxidoreductase [Aneurinibacillus soli]|uniref:Phthiocerol synthesis polyketide synthase type I PpsC n=1 Tax=Aneurinibacillus soli TaxID=1500254 RepID=A0A0U5AS74_9BACL|nr:NAD(P)H-quinone oxidoreductase [Aneurinibacillus soli]PYE58796.1 putative PIG3 family NAD(P)H quinone oxidoreductase [Aneurinibacillus soli]BAU26661.1 Phthiocerol synthesis polyketide synthase type I PpsC [Aneurinibacillus soli]
MKAILVEKETRHLYIGETPDPTVGDDEILVQVKATALNRADLLQKRGLYPPPKGASEIIGLEMAGVIEAVGRNVVNHKPGDRVCALLPGGGYAEKTVIPAGMAIPIPDSFSFAEAAAIPEVFLTAYLNLFWLGGLQPGYNVLIHAGASGVGTAAIQLVREAGATAIVTAGSEEKLATCRKLGASTLINYKDGPFLDAVKEATDGKGVNIILDFIGASYWEQNIKSLAVDGRLVIIGTMGGAKAGAINLGLLLSRRLQVIGTALRSQPVEKKLALTQEFCEFALPRFQDGRLVPVIDSTWDWTQVNEAHAHMEQNKNTGKIILTLP